MKTLTELPLESLSRRDWLKSVGVTSLILSVGASGAVLAQSAAAPAIKYGGDKMPGGVVANPLVFVAIGADGIVSVWCHRSEMGQGVRTSIPMVVADELGANWAQVRVVQALGDEARYGNQNTDGSRSMRHSFAALRTVGASARLMLEMAAAAKWGVPLAEVAARKHEIVHQKTGRKLGYGAVALAAAALPVPAVADLKLKMPAQFNYIGKANVRLIDGMDIVRGRAAYGADTRLEGMLYAVVARPKVLGGKVRSFDPVEALKVPGVLRVIAIDSTPLPAGFHPVGGVAVIARNTWSAMKGREALKIEWDDGPQASYDSVAYRTTLESAARTSWKPMRNEGDAMAALAQAPQRIEAEYYLPHLAHATMEPPVATARLIDGKCEVWAPVQAPEATRDIIASHLGMKKEDVVVHVTLLGGGFGRKSKPDFACEAALLSKAMAGVPVKVQWTREDDVQHDYYHAVALERLESALDEHGKPVAWLHRTAAPTIRSTFVLGAKGLGAGEVGMTALNIPFQIPNIRIEAPEVEAHTRIGWFRSVYNVPHAFAVQSFVAELAAAAKRDPKEYLLELIGPARQIDPRSMADNTNYGESPERYPIDTGRMRNVIELAAQGAKWGRTLPKGRGMGLAVAYSFMSYTATVIEVEVDAKGNLRIVDAHMAIDCGPQVNPERIRSQLEGACIMGLSLALTGEISFKNGRVEQSNFHDYSVLRQSDAPRAIQVHLAQSNFAYAPGGVGEPGLPPVAAALCNAIFAACGKRIRQLPIAGQLAT